MARYVISLIVSRDMADSVIKGLKKKDGPPLVPSTKPVSIPAYPPTLVKRTSSR